MGKFSNQSYVSFGPITKLCNKFMRGDNSLKKESLKEQAMSTDEQKNSANQITSFLGRLAYAAQAQEFVNDNSVNLNLNQAVIFNSYRQSESTSSNFSFQSSSLATRIGSGPLYSR